MSTIRNILTSTKELSPAEFGIFIGQGNGINRMLTNKTTSKSFKKTLKKLKEYGCSDEIINLTRIINKRIEKNTLIRGVAMDYAASFLLINEVKPIGVEDYVYFKSINKTPNEAISGEINEMIKSIYTTEIVKELKAFRKKLIEIGETIL